jgi:hypothetical protein
MHQTDPQTESDTDTSLNAGVGLDREKALAPYLGQLTAGGGTNLALEPWECEVLKKFPEGKDPAGYDWPALVAQGLAFGAKCQAREDQFEDADAAELERLAELGDELIAEMAVGLVLFEELQASVNSLIRSGEMRKVKRLCAFRNKVGQSLAIMKGLIDSESFATASSRATDALAARAELEEEKLQSDASPALEETPHQGPTQYVKDPAPTRMVYRTTVKKRKVIKLLLAVLVVSLTVWIVMTVKNPSYVAPLPLTIEELNHVVGVRNVESRHPSVYVKVDDKAWTLLSPEQRTDALTEIGRVAEQAGYLGAQVWTTDGLTIGQWLKESGVTLEPNSPGQT